MFKKVSRTPHTYSNGKTIIFEEIFYEFCPDLWGEIKSYLLPPKVCPCCNKKAKVKKIPFKRCEPPYTHTSTHRCEECLYKYNRCFMDGLSPYHGWTDLLCWRITKATTDAKKKFSRQKKRNRAITQSSRDTYTDFYSRGLFENYDLFADEYINDKTQY